MDSFVNFFKKIPNKFASSAKELGKVQGIAIIAMLLGRLCPGNTGSLRVNEHRNSALRPDGLRLL